MKSLQFNRAFTLIELLVVIAIVGILSGFIFVSMTSAINSAKDAKRKADLDSLERALMVYSVNHGNTYPYSALDTYPCNLTGNTNLCANTDLAGALGLSTLPADPDSNKSYTYSAVADATSFTLSTILSTGTTYAYNSSGNAWFNGFTYGQYKKTITILNNPGSSVIAGAYPVKLTINTAALVTAGKMRSDCNDLRFTDSGTTAALNYWIESGCNTGSTIVWVKLPNGIPATTGTTINMFYGTQTVAASSGENTFSSWLFDDFNETGISDSAFTSKWTVTGGTPVISGGICNLTNASISSISTFATGYANRNYARLGSNGGSGNYESLNFGASVGSTYVDFGNSGNTNYSFNTYNGSSAQLTNIGGAGTYPTYGVWELQKISGALSRLYINDSLIAGNTQYINTTAGKVQPGSAGSGFVYIGWTLVRPYSSAEPTAGTITFGAEGIGQ